jgi:hypothetical protein
MIEKAITWFTINRKKIGYTLGGVNILSGIMCLSGYGQFSTGLIQIFVGTFVIFDAWLML